MVQRLFVSLIAVSLLAPGSAGAAAKRPGCPTKKAHLFAVEGSVRLYKVGSERYHDWVACSTSSHRRIRLLSSVSGELGADDYQIAGHFIVLHIVSEGVDTVEEDLVVGDLNAGRSYYLYATDPGDKEDHGVTAIPDWTLSPRGDVAFISVLDYELESDVVAWRAGKRTRLDKTTANDISKKSLALAEDHTLYWKHGSEIRTATLK